MANNSFSLSGVNHLANAEKKFSQISAKVSLWSAFIFLDLLITLHFLKPDLDPSWHFISEYQIGRFGWMMSFAFLSLAVSCIALSFALWSHVKIIGSIGLFLLIVSAAGMIIAAIFISDPFNATQESEHGKLHQLGAMLDSIPVASVLITVGLIRKNETWKSARKILIWSTFMVWIGLMAFIVSMIVLFPADGKFGPNVLMGWPNRLMIIVQCLWLMIVSNQAIKINRIGKSE